MKRHEQDPLDFSLLRSLDQFARTHKLSITDLAAQQGLLDSHRVSLQEHISHQARIHGIRVGSMFAHLAATLGSTLLISEEDAGELFHAFDNIQRPDYRIVTQDHEQFLVEVKNFHQKSDPLKPFKIKGSYLALLKKYAQINGMPLKLAIYWSRWNMWSLVDAARYDESKKCIKISMKDAFLHSEMYLLGDYMIGTTPPLSFRIYADKSRARVVSSDGTGAFCISKVCLCCNGVDIDSPDESRVAWYLLFYGNWNQYERIANIEDGFVNFVEMQFTPEVLDDNIESLPFRNLGYLSQMITKEYLRLTSTEGEVTNLIPAIQPEQLGLRIPEDYEGTALPLWRFKVYPKHIEPAITK